MSYRLQAYDTQQGVSRPRDTTVPRGATAPTWKQAGHQPRPTRSRTVADSTLHSDLAMMDQTKSTHAQPRLRPTGTPRSRTTPATLKATAPSASVPSFPSTKRLALDSNPLSQEVPFLMDPDQLRTGGYDGTPSARAARPWQSSSSATTSLDTESDAIFGIVMPRTTSASRTVDLPPRLIPELQALAAASSSRHPDVSNKSGSSISSPSTWLSSSTSPWSASSTTTPLSWSSASPGIVKQTPMMALGNRSRAMPVRMTTPEETPDVPAVPVSHSLPAVTETPSSRRSPAQRRMPLDTAAPTPPPRTSSAKRSLSRSSSRSHKFQTPTPPSSEMERSPLTRRKQLHAANVGESSRRSYVAHAHGQLQQSLEQSSSNQAQSEMGYPFGDGAWPGFSTRSQPSQTPSSDALFRPFGDMETKEVNDSTDNGIAIVGASDAAVQSSTGRVGKLSRLGIFGRRAKSPAKEVERSPRKLQRRGPAAGTGHEGYGKYGPGRRGRSKSSQENTSANNSESERSVSSTRRTPFFSTKGSRSGSRHNRGSQSDLDEFASTRMRPIPIMGGSGTGTRDDSGVQIDISSRTISPLSSSIDELVTPSQSQDSFSQGVIEISSALQGDVSALGRRPTLAVRRSQRFGTAAETFNVPTPIRTQQLSAPVYVTSQSEGGTSALTVSMSTPSTTPDFSRPNDVHNTTKDKKPRKLRWNIFRKKDTEMKPEQTAMPSSASPEELSVAISTVTLARPAPYYAIIDSESEVNTNGNAGDFLSELVETPAISPLMESYETETAESAPRQETYHDEGFLPTAPSSPPHFFARPPLPVPLQSPSRETSFPNGQPRQKAPRLARIGRIPPVVSRTERQHYPSPSSFSQPFPKAPIGETPSEPPGMRSPVPALQVEARKGFLPSLAYNPGHSAQPTTPPEEHEFLRFRSRSTSERSASSASEAFVSIREPPPTPEATDESHPSRLTQPSRPYVPQSPTLDEVWNEYDDFIDHVMSPSKTKRTATGSAETRMMDYSRDRNQGIVSGRDAFHSSPASSGRGQRVDNASFTRRPIGDEASMISTEPSMAIVLSPGPAEHSEPDRRLRRSRIISALHSSIDPSSPFSIRDFLTEYENHPRSSERTSAHTSTIGRSSDSLPISMTVPEAQIASHHQENVALLDVVERSKDPVGQSELHYASLMVGKWLSFGRVLFSPAHDEVQRISERHILVIDGLGNEDWSIYCAVTYEAQRAFVHDMKEKSSMSRSTPPQASHHAPDNHRRAEISSFYERFPFQSAYFCAVVVRFPPAMAEAKLKNLMAECRRVLRPGGFIELMLLDLDIVNMGVQTRRAVRELKFRMTTADKHISLRPIIDNVQSVLGARGFSNISRCVVGVPVAGRPSKSTDSPSSSRSSGGSDGFSGPSSGDPRQATASPRMTFGQGRRGANLSLNDLIADHSDNADTKIGKIVSRTARRWWQHCFEASVISDGNLSTSIFANKNVLGECRSRGSSFKMLIAYAQRPVFETKRRTMSESAVSTMATAGARKHIHPAASGSSTA